MEQTKRITIDLPESLKRWLERQAAARLAEGREFGKRSVNAVVVDLIKEASERKAA